MPYMLISTQLRLECGPTLVGDSETADPAVLKLLDAKAEKHLGNSFVEYFSPHTPCYVLNKLEKNGWKVISMTGIGQTCAWTLHKEEEKP